MFWTLWTFLFGVIDAGMFALVEDPDLSRQTQEPDHNWSMTQLPQPVNYTVRPKRLVNMTGLVEVPDADHESKYPFVVGIKTMQDNFKGGSTRVACTGTVVSPHLIMTTAQCVLNPKIIKIYPKMFTMFDTDNGTAQNFINVTLQTKSNSIMPNPVYFGSRLLPDFSWINDYTTPSRRSKHSFKYNVALVYVDKPIVENIQFPIMGTDPAKYFEVPPPTLPYKIFGFCNSRTNKTSNREGTIKLQMADIMDLKLCDKASNQIKDYWLSNYICSKNASGLCEGDEGGPVFVTSTIGKDARLPNVTTPEPNATTTTSPAPAPPSNDTMPLTTGNTMPPTRKPPPEGPVMAAMISYTSGPGRNNPTKTLIFIWPFRYWVDGVIYASFMTTPAPVTCNNATNVSTTKKAKRTTTVAVPVPESYYDNSDYRSIVRLPYKCGGKSIRWSAVLLSVTVTVAIIAS